MCKCTPEMRTPFCGKPGCEWPGGKPEGARSAPSPDYKALAAELAEALDTILIWSQERGSSDTVLALMRSIERRARAALAAYDSARGGR